jgi:hypothetical protein
MVPRTDDLNDMVVGLLASPFVGYRSGLRGAARLKAVERVVHRIDSLNDIPPSVAIAVVNDESMATKIGEETDEAAVGELVDAALSAKAQQLEEQVAAAASRVVKAEQERDRAEALRREADTERARLQAESDEAQAHQAATVKQLQESIDAHRTEAESLPRRGAGCEAAGRGRGGREGARTHRGPTSTSERSGDHRLSRDRRRGGGADSYRDGVGHGWRDRGDRGRGVEPVRRGAHRRGAAGQRDRGGARDRVRCRDDRRSHRGADRWRPGYLR